MKKTLLILAALSILSGCSSLEKESTSINSIQSDLLKIEKDNTVTAATITEYKNRIKISKIELAKLEKEITAIDAFINPETVFNKSGVIIKKEKNKLTLIMPADVVFDFDKADIRKEFEPLLDIVAEALMIYKGVVVKIDGHTDNIGTYDYNLNLSQMRAARAKQYLILKGVSDIRIATEGHSFSSPVATNSTPEDREKNRRIEIMIKR